MIPNFALSLSFEGIALLRRMGPRWARIDDVPLDHPDFDSRVIALRDRAESLDPSGAQVALIIPNEQIRYLDQPDLGGDETARDLAIRASLDGATPYAVNELKYDYVVTDGRLQIAAVAIETLDEAQSFAVEHGFDPVSFMAQAPEGAFDSAVFFGKAKGWSKAASRPARAIRIVEADEAALQPLPKPDLFAAAAPKPQAEKPETPPAKPAHPEPAQSEPAQPEAHKPDAKPAAPRSATPTPAPAPTPVESAQPAPPEAAATDTAAEAPASKSPAPRNPAPTPAPAPGDQPPKAPAPKVTGAEPSVPAAPKIPSAPPRPETGAPATAPKAPSVPSAPPASQGTPKAPAVPKRTEPAPAAPPKTAQPTAKTPASRPTAPVQPPAPSAAPAETEAERPYTFSTIRATRPGATAPSGDATAPHRPVTGELKARFTPVAPAVDNKTEMPDQPAKAPAPEARTGFFSTPAASALLARASAAADEAETASPSGEAPAPAPAQPAKRPALPPKLKGKTKAAPKPGVKPIPKVAAARAAGLAAAPAREAKDDEFLAAPAAARKGVPAPGKPLKHGSVSRPNPLAKLAALRGPQAPQGQHGRSSGPALTGAGGGAAAIPAGMRFNQPSERDRMTVFGARDRDMTGGKPRYLGLILTAILLLFLAGVAAWATVFLDDGLARLFRSADEPASAVASLPDGDTDAVPPPGDDGVILESATPPASAAPAISARPVARPEGEVQIAAFDPPATAPESQVAPLAVPTDPRQLTPEEAAASYAASGIWQRAPAKPHRPPEDGVDEVYAASIDPNIQIFDAVALPQAKDLAREPDFQDPGLPPPAGLTFDFDERDLVRATPEGALTPDGLRIFTGRPPVIPPLRGEVALAPDAEPDAPGAIRTRLNAMPRVRPRTRPDDLIELRERSQLGGISRSELAAIRPVMRPPTAQEQAEIDAPEATDQAVRRSLVPVGRPRNMAAIVDNADRSLVPAEPVRTAAAVAPRTVAPRVPSSASVARAATSTNAINLKKINLIGVYGTADNRRALVRLANGKYQKVKVGDRLDGGRVTAIGEEALRYTKGSRNLTLTMPQT
ncbi:hypothetical protein [Mameliella sp.]|uniref:hypothetical protein n=1 Tax=Mameliella sp. TaxID=1924940 RepID=UPI003BA9C595